MEEASTTVSAQHAKAQVLILAQPPHLPRSDYALGFFHKTPLRVQSLFHCSRGTFLNSQKPLQKFVQYLPAQLCTKNHSKQASMADTWRGMRLPLGTELLISVSWQLDARAILTEHINKLTIWKNCSNFVDTLGTTAVQILKYPTSLDLNIALLL